MATVLKARRLMGDDIPVIVRMRVECARCGHDEDETFEFDLPLAKAPPMEAYEPGRCSECKAPVQMHLKRTQQRQQISAGIARGAPVRLRRTMRKRSAAGEDAVAVELPE